MKKHQKISVLPPEGTPVKVHLETGLILCGKWMNSKSDFVIKHGKTMVNINSAFVLFTEWEGAEKK